MRGRAAGRSIAREPIAGRSLFAEKIAQEVPLEALIFVMRNVARFLEVRESLQLLYGFFGLVRYLCRISFSDPLGRRGERR